MSTNTYQPSYLNRPSTIANQSNFIKNPQMHYLSTNQSSNSNKTPQTLSPHLNPPSSMNQNYLSVTPKLTPQKFSPYHAQNKDLFPKSSQINTAKSMVFMGNEKQTSANFTPKSSFGGLSKLSTMARMVEKNFDDSKDIGLNNQNEENKKQSSHQNGLNYLKPDQNYKKNFLNTGDNFGNRYKQTDNQKGNTYKSFIYPSNNSNIPDSPSKKFDNLQFLKKYKNEKTEKNQQNLTNNQLNNNPSNFKQQRQNKQLTFTHKQTTDTNKINKNLLYKPQSQHHKLFHQYSAPNLKNYNHQSSYLVNNLNLNKNQNNSNNTSYFHQFQTSHQHVKSYQDSKNNSTKKQDNSPTINPQNKYLSPQIPKSSFMKKFNSDKIDGRSQNQKTSLSSGESFNHQNLNNKQIINNYQGKILNFNKKPQQGDYPSSTSTTQENTPVKQKFVTPTFFKNRIQSNKTPNSQTSNYNYNSPSILNGLKKQQKNLYYQKSNLQLNSEKKPASLYQISACTQDADQSFSYMQDDFKVQQPKQWCLQDFQLGDKLGKGAFGDVYIARQKQLGFMCVLKKMSKKRIKQQKREQHVIRQLKIQMYLNHKHLTAMYGYFHDKDYIYLILQYLPDGNLSQIKRKKKTSQKQTAYIIKQVCEGLSFMHKQNIIHRDIKPQNIFVSQGYIKLGDFGCSVFTDGLRKTVVSCLEYSSPQQLNNGYYNQKIDVWGVGILAFQLLTGKSPYENKIMNMAQGSIEQVDFSELKFPQDLKLSDLAKDFIISLLNIDPIDRLDIQQALQHKFITSNKQQEYVLN